MKILFIGTDGNKSGASLSMVVLAEKIKANGGDIRIILPYGGALEEELISRNLIYDVIPYYNWITKENQENTVRNKCIRWIKAILNKFADIRVSKIIQQFNPDIIHINTICAGVGAGSAIKQNKSLIWHIREFVEEDHGFQFWDKKSAYNIIGKSSKLIAISASVHSKFAPIFGVEKVRTIYNGVDIKKFYYSEKHCFQEKSLVYICMGGSIAESKGQYLLVEAAKYMVKEINDFEIHFVGTGNESYIENLKQRVRDLKLDGYVFFDGFKDCMELEWRKADVAVVASRAEAFGRVTVEAMLSGALVIGADTAGTAEIISHGQNGILFKHENAKDLAEHIIWAVKNKETSKKLALNGREMAKERYSADRNANEIIELYKEVLNEHKKEFVS